MANIKQLNPQFLSSLQALMAAAPGNVEIFSAYRDPAHQARILRNGLAKRGLSVSRWDSYVAQADGDVVKAGELARPWLRSTGITRWIAPPGASMHQRGLAADIRYANDKTRQWVHGNARAHGLHFPMPHEPWHIEPVNARGAFAKKALAEANTPQAVNGKPPEALPPPPAQPALPNAMTPQPNTQPAPEAAGPVGAPPVDSPPAQATSSPSPSPYLEALDPNFYAELDARRAAAANQDRAAGQSIAQSLSPGFARGLIAAFYG